MEGERNSAVPHWLLKTYSMAKNWDLNGENSTLVWSDLFLVLSICPFLLSEVGKEKDRPEKRSG